MVCSDFSDCECLDYSEINDMFPDAKFRISIPYCQLNAVLSTLPSIWVTNIYDCYCYDGKYKKPARYHIKGTNITYKYVIEHLIEKGFGGRCNHNFLEDISGSGEEFTLEFGS